MSGAVARKVLPPLVGPGTTPPPPVPAVITAEQIAAVSLPEAAAAMEQAVYEARVIAESPGNEHRRADVQHLNRMLAVYALVSGLTPEQLAQQFAQPAIQQGA